VGFPPWGERVLIDPEGHARATLAAVENLEVGVCAQSLRFHRGNQAIDEPVVAHKIKL
jgi:hypothetical protein